MNLNQRIFENRFPISSILSHTSLFKVVVWWAACLRSVGTADDFQQEFPKVKECFQEFSPQVRFRFEANDRIRIILSLEISWNIMEVCRWPSLCIKTRWQHGQRVSEASFSVVLDDFSASPQRNVAHRGARPFFCLFFSFFHTVSDKCLLCRSPCAEESGRQGGHRGKDFSR